MVFGIEINNVIRDFNSQVLKYYKKDFDKGFDEDLIDMDKSSIVDDIPFKSQKVRRNFINTDYVLELYGSAEDMKDNLKNNVNYFYKALYEKGHDLLLFSCGDSPLTVQSTYFYFSKGIRVRRVVFPINPSDIWKDCDCVITINREIVESKPKGKQVILIEKSDNKDLEDKCDLVYKDLFTITKDKNLLIKLNQTKQEEVENNKFITKIKNFLKRNKA